jgi:hypothetical protein
VDAVLLLFCLELDLGAELVPLPTLELLLPLLELAGFLLWTVRVPRRPLD